MNEKGTSLKFRRERPALTKLHDARALLAEAEKALDLQRSRRKLRCSCGSSHMIKDIDLIVTHWYVQPHGCTEGDYWLEGEWNFRCPKYATVARVNRLMFHDDRIYWRDRDDFNVGAEATFKRLYRHLFKSRKDTHEKPTYPFYCNYDADKNRKRFELPGVPPETEHWKAADTRPWKTDH